MKRRMIEPFIAVGATVSTSLLFLKDKTIDVKTIYILGVSFLLAAIMDYLMVRLHILTYEEKVNGDDDEKKNKKTSSTKK